MTHKIFTVKNALPKAHVLYRTSAIWHENLPKQYSHFNYRPYLWYAMNYCIGTLACPNHTTLAFNLSNHEESYEFLQTRPRGHRN